MINFVCLKQSYTQLHLSKCLYTVRHEGGILLCCTKCYIGNPAAAIREWGACFTLSYILYDTVGSVIARFVVTFVNWYYLGGFL